MAMSSLSSKMARLRCSLARRNRSGGTRGRPEGEEKWELVIDFCGEILKVWRFWAKAGEYESFQPF